MSVGDRIMVARQTPLVRSTTALVVNTGINGALGLAYWVAAARLYDPSVVGRGAAGVSGLLFVASLGWIGLQQVLLRYLPTAGAAGIRLVVAVYASAIAIAGAGALAFLAFASTDPNLHFLVAGPGEALGFLVAVFVWVVFSLQDPALIGLGRSAWVPLENLGFGLAKLVLLVLFTGLASPWSILGSWALGASWLVIIVSLAIRRRLLDQPPASAVLERGRLARFALGQHAIAVATAAPDTLAPLIVLAFVGDRATAFYYAAWTVSFSLRLLAVNVGSAATVEGAHGGPRAVGLARQVRRLAVLVVVPAVVIVWLAAGFVMSFYGASYAEAGTDVLRLLVIAVIPFTGLTLFVVAERIAERTAAAFAAVAIATTVALALDLVLVPRIGIVGAGWGWLGGQVLGLLVGLAVGRRRAVASG